MTSAPRVLIIVENLTVPLDRRVWQEAVTLRDAGYTVSVICPVGGAYRKRYELLEGIHVFRHPLPYEADGPLGGSAAGASSAPRQRGHDSRRCSRTFHRVPHWEHTWITGPA